MPLFTFDIGDRARNVSRFIAGVRSELQRAFAHERKTNRLTQQNIAAKLGVHRSVINRQLMGFENMTVRSVADLAWAMGWEPEFRLSKQTDQGNYFVVEDAAPVKFVPTKTATANVIDLAA